MNVWREDQNVHTSQAITAGTNSTSTTRPRPLVAGAVPEWKMLHVTAPRPASRSSVPSRPLAEAISMDGTLVG